VPPAFGLTDPSTEGLGVGGGPRGGGLGLRATPLAPGGAAWLLEIESGAPAHVQLELLDVSGRRLARLADREVGAGITAVTWDGRDETGRGLASGLVFACLRSGSRIRTARLIVLR
jgi:hypothetical protein